MALAAFRNPCEEDSYEAIDNIYFVSEKSYGEGRYVRLIVVVRYGIIHDLLNHNDSSAKEWIPERFAPSIETILDSEMRPWLWNKNSDKKEKHENARWPSTYGYRQVSVQLPFYWNLGFHKGFESLQLTRRTRVRSHLSQDSTREDPRRFDKIETYFEVVENRDYNEVEPLGKGWKRGNKGKKQEKFKLSRQRKWWIFSKEEVENQWYLKPLPELGVLKKKGKFPEFTQEARRQYSWYLTSGIVKSAMSTPIARMDMSYREREQVAVAQRLAALHFDGFRYEGMFNTQKQPSYIYGCDDLYEYIPLRFILGDGAIVESLRP